MWTPSYWGARGVPYSVDGVEAAECPVSLISARSVELITIYHRAKRSGVAMFGPDLSAWPAWAADLFDALDVEQIKLDNAKWEAEHAE